MKTRAPLRIVALGHFSTVHPIADSSGMNFRTLAATMVRALRSENGQGLVEYALIIALVSVIAVSALNLLGQKASNSLSNAAGTLS